MNIILLFLILIVLISILSHVLFMKRQKMFHELIIEELNGEFQLQLMKQNSMQSNSNVNFDNQIDFKLLIIKKQVELLREISNQNGN
ncbi:MULTISPECIES: hypothetical protein [unclassified Flavobacterium]|uniref:hypothetical protein n=1 Tax=unclassified Flavobacterium TaxID=196869 RepID=UPI001292BBDE|nr:MULTISPECIES: hypothetical protein [unclassified Flavobacterium]MQP51932.1 hypothetical protein [Flavobacterium sp. LMO9]MQP61801.1 hypothetical protein [Flavobacterium sp. LMO6]